MTEVNYFVATKYLTIKGSEPRFNGCTRHLEIPCRNGEYLPLCALKQLYLDRPTEEKH